MPNSNIHHIALNLPVSWHLTLSVIRGVADVISQRPAYRLLLQNGHATVDWEVILERRPEIVICALQNPGDLEKVARVEGVVVNVSEIFSVEHIPSVLVDNAACGALVGRHLLGAGLRHFGYIGFGPHVNSQKRGQGFFSVLPEDIDAESNTLALPIEAWLDWEQMKQTMKNWARKRPRPSGVYVSSDTLARAFIEAVHELGLRIPHDFSVVGTGNYDLDTRITVPHLSSVSLNWEQAGQRAALKAIRLFEGHPEPPLTRIPPLPVTIRESSDYFHSEDPVVAKALRYIKDHHLEELQVGDIAEAAGASRRVLEKRFRAAMSEPVYAYVTDIRLRRAKTMLVETEDTVDEVARACGFGEARYLSVALRRETGLTPAAFRKKLRTRRG